MKKLILLFSLALSSCAAYQQIPTIASGKLLLDNISFETGTIDLDLRGKNIFQQSFVGVIFHATDTAHAEVVYFRPFNFRASDSLRRKHAVQYMRLPDEPWQKLRIEYPSQYEQSVHPEPFPNAWFHATIRVTSDSVLVWVNHAHIPSLRVKRFMGQQGNRFGFFVDGLPGEFRRLKFKRQKRL